VKKTNKSVAFKYLDGQYTPNSDNIFFLGGLMTTFYSLYIPAGTKVLGKKGMVELSGDAYISGATREKGGEFYYTIGSQEFYCSSGCCNFWQDS
jgi:hypothetical protein